MLYLSVLYLTFEAEHIVIASNIVFSLDIQLEFSHTSHTISPMISLLPWIPAARGGEVHLSNKRLKAKGDSF